MELRQLRYFVFLAEELHFGRAARRLEIATPTLSQQIAALERALDHQLVERSSHGVSLTDAGGALLEEARLVLAAADRARDVVREAGRRSSTVSIRVATGLITVLRREFPALESHPALDVQLAVSNGMDAELAVLHGTVDAAFVWGQQRSDPALRSLKVATSAVSLALPLGHRLASYEQVPVAELREETIALFARSLSPRVYDHFLQHLLEGDSPRPGQLLQERVRIDSSDAMLRAVVEHGAVAPYVHVVADEGEHAYHGQLVLRPLSPSLDLPVALLWRDPARPHLRRLIDQLFAAPAGALGDG